MSGAEFRAARERVGLSPAEIAAVYGTSVDTVLGWEVGRGTVPLRVERDLLEIRGVVAIGDEVQRRVAAAGFPQCSWLDSHPDLTMEAFRAHARTCPTCHARDQFALDLERQTEPPGLWARLRRLILG